MKSKFFNKETHYHLGRPAHAESISTFLADNFDADKTCLEIGVGNGRGTKFLAAHFKKVIAIEPVADLSAMDIDVFNAKNVELYSVPIEESGGLNLDFDYLICFQATHWFYDFEQYQKFYGHAQKPVLDISTQVKILDQPEFFRELIDKYKLEGAYRGFDYPRETIFDDSYDVVFSADKVAHGICSTSWIDHSAFDEILQAIQQRFGKQEIRARVTTEVKEVGPLEKGTS